MPIETKYAPAERSGKDEITAQRELIASFENFREIIDSLERMAAIINQKREIVYANNELIKSLSINSIEEIIGKRPGEAISCIHYGKEEGGCGTTEFCRYCGAVNTILESQAKGEKATGEARLTTHTDAGEKSWELKVTSSPIRYSGHTFYIFTLEDISGEKRREAFERIFFHDILNIAGGLNGLLLLLKSDLAPEETESLILKSEEVSRNLIEEIHLYRQIRAAEQGDLRVNPEVVMSEEFLSSVVDSITFHEATDGKRIEVDNKCANISFMCDKVLLRRVLINLLKNAAEATPVGGIVKCSCILKEGNISFIVHNESVMPKEVQMQIFQRSFSTKGKGRGIGTYSIKLLTETYLRGKVSFRSEAGNGTSFRIDLPL